MQVLRYDTPMLAIENNFSHAPKIFLAGPTVRAHQTHLKSWRPDAIEIFEQLGFDGSIVIPEFLVRNEANLEKGEIPLWEFNSIRESDCVMFWVPRTEETIGLTTNYELGYWTARDRAKVVYGRPDNAYRISYPDILWTLDSEYYCDRASQAIYNTLENTVKAAMVVAAKQFERRSKEERL